MSKLIGILAEEEQSSSSVFKAVRYFTNSYYADAITLSGGVPILLLRSSLTSTIISRLDGLLVQGGVDVTPSLYNEEKSKLCGDTQIEEDLFHLEIIKEANRLNKKILGICRGCQIINVAFGGSLYQDLSEFTTFNHKAYEEPTKASHLVKVNKESQLFNLLNKEKVMVNSLHHQALKEVAKDFKVTARAEDGCIEAIEKENILAVQWHPEALRFTDESMINLFSWLCN